MATDGPQISPGQNGNGTTVYEFGPFRFDSGQRTLTRDGVEIKLKPKTLELLQLFVERDNEVINKQQMMEAIWPGAFVEEANLTVHVSQIRKLFAESNGHSLSIETFPKIGYRFTGDVRVVGSGSRGISSKNGVDRGIGAADGSASGTAVRRNISASRWITVGLAIFVAVAGGAFALQRWSGWMAKGALTVTRIPGTEQSTSISFSPNGEFIAHTVSYAGKRTLTLTNVNSGSSLQLLPTDDASYNGLTFSKDNSFLYFVKVGPEFNTLFKVPILGGTVTRVLDRVDNRISFSPDGRQFCFVRKLSDGVTAIMAANADGTDEREVARREAPQFYSGFEISWSPDGRLIANAAGTAGNSPNLQLIGVDVDTGQETLILDRKWSGIDGLEWLRDGSGLVAGIFEGPATPTQVWFIPFPAGEPRQITNDLENYGSVGVSADGSTIMAGQFTDNTSVWVISPGVAESAEPVRAGKHHKFNWIRWAPDGGFVFGSDASGNRDVWHTNLDGSGERTLTAGPQSNVMPVATADGRYIIFSAFRDNNGLFELWRMDSDGTNQVQLTPSGSGAWQPSLSPDGKWVFYTSGAMDGPPMKRRIWKVSVDGGEPTLYLERAAYQPDVSPDGKYIACWIKSDEKAKPQAAIFSIDGGDLLSIIDGPVGNRLDWTPDGKGLSYIVTADGVSNIWTQPLAGGPPKQETSFRSETIRSFDWAGDGRLLVSRFHKTRDVMLIRNFR